jgi:hypothetical protein
MTNSKEYKFWNEYDKLETNSIEELEAEGWKQVGFYKDISKPSKSGSISIVLEREIQTEILINTSKLR